MKGGKGGGREGLQPGGKTYRPSGRKDRLLTPPHGHTRALLKGRRGGGGGEGSARVPGNGGGGGEDSSQ